MEKFGRPQEPEYVIPEWVCKSFVSKVMENTVRLDVNEEYDGED